jgi:hypothetical protein
MADFIKRRPQQIGDDFSAEKKQQIKCAIEQRVASLVAMIDDGSVVRNAQQLMDTEKSIAALTDEIAGCVVEAVVARSVQDDALSAKATALVKQSPVRMKKRDARTVEIQPFRGNPFTIETTYYTKAGQSMKQADKKGGSTRD